jgi:hypothetical protein
VFDRFRKKPSKDTPSSDEQPPSASQPMPEASAGEPPEPETYAIEVDEAYSFSVLFYSDSDGLAWQEDERIDKLAELLNARPEIKQAFREDREFILVDAPGLERATFEALVAQDWDEAAIGTQYKQFNDAGELVDAVRPTT